MAMEVVFNRGAWCIRHKHDTDLWWNRDAGWVSVPLASVYTAEEKSRLTSPDAGTWRPFSEHLEVLKADMTLGSPF
jgi:hypothetical protein